ncbi:sialate O-acetylesterase [Rhizobium leguminosarum]|uniref:sialate O-acetylesterase n=1 Tax=Rhizobium leguminosarum TaxID=384 RepID=UPI001C900D63|nr:sialate O-acetylesterase [Rhizobium leguminosarum]MBY2919009.1 sialate O-acetylesterase [Rhizobium leguminosarum]MBY2974658.1 sialate O-acetylesterase [Rhizobium leguminosarum]MBY2982139.1 sialate O-acetylesterase [Rhizobium leguminosarum]MBY3001241.1 sialate O-acetylesterase [Rhizobium leguminosarum]MBY3010607.1 sialate O-acetylesterase [Rhizobium leguminosarum]
MLKTMAVGLAALIAMYVLGGMSARHEIFPWPQLSALKKMVGGEKAAAPSRYTFDDKERLIGDESKTLVACPPQTDRTAVLLILGQSNAANYGGQRHRSNYGARVVNAFDKRCFIAASPLLGSTNTRGEYWTLLGNNLIASGQNDNVILAPLAYSGSEVARWAAGGDFNRVLVDTVKQLQGSGYRITNVLWVQGEADLVMGTTAKAYQERFMSMVDTLRQHGVEAPVYISIASKCLEPSNGGFKEHIPHNAIVRAQLALSKSSHGIREGVNSDALLDGDDRYDDCHFGGTGGEKAARAWLNLLRGDRHLETSQ